MKMPDNPPGKRQARSLRFYWILSILLVSIILAALFSVLLIQHRIADLTAASNAHLLTAAEMAREIAGPDFHDHIRGPDSVSREQFEKIVARNDDLCRRLGLQYLWSVLQVDGELVFTTATHSDVNDPASAAASFFEVHRDPDAFSAALGEDLLPEYSTFNNEWGTGRMVLVPRKDALGRTYIFGASIQMEEYDALFWQTVRDGLLLGAVLLAGVLILGLVLARRLTQPILNLAESADRMAAGDLDAALPGGYTREVQSLSASFERLRLNLRQRILELQIIEPRLSLALRAGGVGIWDWDCVANTLVWDDQMYALYGISKGSFGGAYESWRAGLHPDDVERGDLEIAQALRGEKEFNTEFRVIWPDGSVHDIQAMAFIMRDADGKPLHMTGTNWDVTHRKRTEEALRESECKYRLLFENMTAGFALHEMIYDKEGNPLDYRYIEVNPAFERLTGAKAQDLIGHTVKEVMPNTEQYWIETYGRVAATGEPVSYQNYSQEIGRTFDVWAFSPAPGRFAVVFYDITERKRAEDALRESEARNRMILDHSSDLIWNLSPQGVFMYASPSWKTVTGYAAEEITGMPFQPLVHEEDISACMTFLAELLENRHSSQSPEYRVRHADGVWHWHQAVGNPILDADGVVASVIGVSRDITERKLVEEELLHAKILMNETILQSPLPMALASAKDLQFKLINQAAEEFLLINAYDYLHKTPQQIQVTWQDYTPDGLPLKAEELPLPLALNGIAVRNMEIATIRNDGSKVWQLASGTPILDESGNLMAALLTMENITERKKQMEELEGFFTVNLDLLCIADMEGHFIKTNKAWNHILGYSSEELNGMKFLEFIHPDDMQATLKAMSNLSEGEDVLNFSNRYRCKDGTYRYIEWRSHPHGNLIYAAARDITSRKLAEEMLGRVNNLLLAKNKELEQMVYVASHDLRSPLVNIDGYSRELKLIVDELESGLLQGALPEALTSIAASSLQEMRSDLGFILSSTAQMDGLLSGLLKLSRSGRAALNITNLNVDTLVTQVLAAVEFQVLESRVTIERSPLPACQGDEVAVSQVFANLINNAIKFRHPGRAGILRISGTVKDGQAVYCVEDNGIGIALAHQEKIFDLFQRLDPEAYPGEGLGLTIVRQTLYRLGGSVRVESEPGSGSRFFVSLPVGGVDIHEK